MILLMSNFRKILSLCVDSPSKYVINIFQSINIHDLNRILRLMTMCRIKAVNRAENEILYDVVFSTYTYTFKRIRERERRRKKNKVS